MLDFCVNTHFSAAKIRFFDEFTKDFCVNTHFPAVKSVFIICSCSFTLISNNCQRFLSVCSVYCLVMEEYFAEE